MITRRELLAAASMAAATCWSVIGLAQMSDRYPSLVSATTGFRVPARA